MNGLNGKNAIVCGGTSGIGLAIAKRLNDEGTMLCAVARNERELDPGIHFVAADLATSEGCERAFHAATDKIGPIDLLLANSGGPPVGPTLSFNDQTWLDSFENSFLSVVRMVRLCLPGMLERKHGRIVAITSISGVEPIDNLVLSNSLRPSVHAFLKTLSNEYVSSGVTFNSIAPGYTATDRLLDVIPEEKMPSFKESLRLKRLVEPSETAGLAAFLMSVDGAGISGSVIGCDGGELRSL